MATKKLRTLKPTPLKGKLKPEDIRAAVKAVTATRLQKEKQAAVTLRLH